MLFREDVKFHFLQGLSPSALKIVLGAAKRRNYPANSIVVRQNMPADRFFMVESGQARYFYLTRDGRKLILKWLRKGEVFGVAALTLPPCQYLVSAETIQDSHLLVWDRAEIRKLIVRFPVLLDNSLLVGTEYLTLYIATHVALVSQNAAQRLAHILIALAQGNGRHVEHGLQLEITNEELANAANITHFTASRLLRQWHKQGAIEKHRGSVVLCSHKGLLASAHTS